MCDNLRQNERCFPLGMRAESAEKCSSLAFPVGSSLKLLPHFPPRKLPKIKNPGPLKWVGATAILTQNTLRNGIFFKVFTRILQPGVGRKQAFFDLHLPKHGSSCQKSVKSDAHARGVKVDDKMSKDFQLWDWVKIRLPRIRSMGYDSSDSKQDKKMRCDGADCKSLMWGETYKERVARR